MLVPLEDERPEEALLEDALPPLIEDPALAPELEGDVVEEAVGVPPQEERENKAKAKNGKRVCFIN